MDVTKLILLNGPEYQTWNVKNKELKTWKQEELLCLGRDWCPFCEEYLVEQNEQSHQLLSEWFCGICFARWK